MVRFADPISIGRDEPVAPAVAPEATPAQPATAAGETGESILHFQLRFKSDPDTNGAQSLLLSEVDIRSAWAFFAP